MRQGGNCEDYAVAKYVALRFLKVPAADLRIVVVEDLQHDSMHAIVAVYDDTRIWILDNQLPAVRASSTIASYRPVYSINEEHWWVHKAP